MNKSPSTTLEIPFITSWNPRGAILAKHARLQLVIDRWSLSSDLKIWYVFQTETFRQVQIVASNVQFLGADDG